MDTNAGGIGGGSDLFVTWPRMRTCVEGISQHFACITMWEFTFSAYCQNVQMLSCACTFSTTPWAFIYVFATLPESLVL